VALKDYPKWQTSFASWQKDGSKSRINDSTFDLEDGGPSKDGMAPWPRGHKASKQDLPREASSIAMKNTLRTVMAEKEEANAKRDSRRHWEKVEQMLSFADIQRKNYEVQ
jgi:hypothetical protein